MDSSMLHEPADSLPATAASASAAAQSTAATRAYFQSWTARHGAPPAAEYESRLATFTETLQRILAINTDPSASWVAEPTAFATLTQAEFRATFGGAPPLPSPRLQAGRRRRSRALLADPPAVVDWPAAGKVTPVKNQDFVSRARGGGPV